jgi:cytochrome c-type biogenesis protein CcmH
VSLAKEQDGAAPPDLLTNYGEALTLESGQVTQEAEAAFNEALKEDPKNLMSRYYVGVAHSEHGDKKGALALWQGVLADAPPNAPWRGALVNQVAALTAESGGGAPNPEAMVAQLASQLESNPDDLERWVMLIRSYSVLNHKDQAKTALAKARNVFAKDKAAQAELAATAKEFSLD